MRIYGADYYPEHWDQEIWDDHIKMMKEYGIDWVRIGEFDWAIVEPTDGVFDFTLLDEAIKKLKDSGIKIILGTPTTTPPAWLVKKYPEILPIDHSGRVRDFGSRRHYTPNSPIYRQYATRLTEKYVQHYLDVADMWQVDNEFGCHGTTYSFTESDRIAFIKWLKDRYEALDNLNKAWGTIFWSQVYRDWDEITFPLNTPTFENPHQMLDIYRFMSDSNIDFMNAQIEIIRKYSDKPITHNFMVDFMDLDYRRMAKYIDLVSWDNYISTDDYEPFRQSANHVLMRSLKKSPFLIMEQQPGRVNWKLRNENYPGNYLAMWTKQAYLDGALGVMVFRFDQIRFGAEQFHTGLLDYSGRPTQRLSEFSKGKSETDGTIEVVRQVAIYFDYENEWIHRINHVNKEFKYWDSVVEIYKAVRELGYNVDFVFADDDIEEYDILIVPYAFKIGEGFANMISDFKGPVYMTCMSGLKDEKNWIVKRAPDNLIEEFGVEVVDFGAIREKEFLLHNVPHHAKYWQDEVELYGAQVLGTFTDGMPALTLNVLNGKERFYIATVVDKHTWIELLHDKLPLKVVGTDVQFAEDKSNMYVLNLRNEHNIVYVDSQKLVLEAFELKKLAKRT
ncbi:MAG TPA: beta-galactosidase [Fervidobacterium sp.]|nr:beta-galactosidase [Fervidobacterium sp.]HOM73530.1 beta-galactosidase [Fervidobacterium sp.]HPP17418.1 beta-galactosidase [Fervidobacterium sp.]HRD20005.1 beta-galactosidase [Fervidobacterium sp.]